MSLFRATGLQPEIPGIRLAGCLLLAIALLAPFQVQGQTVQSPLHNPAGTASLQGLVRDSTGRPIAGAALHLQVKDGTQNISSRADASGSYRFSGLREGIYMLRAEMAGTPLPLSAPASLDRRRAKRLDLTLESAGNVRAQTSSSGTPGAGPPEFYDEPQFTVAGVTDGTNLGSDPAPDPCKTNHQPDPGRAHRRRSHRPGALQASSSPSDPAEAALRAQAGSEPGSFEANHRLGQWLVDHGKLRKRWSIWSGLRGSSRTPTKTTTCWRSHTRTRVNTNRHAGNARALLASQEKDHQALAPRAQAEVHHLLGDIDEKSGDPLDAVQEYQ